MQTLNEVAKSGIISIREADNMVNNGRPLHAALRSDSPALRQPTFDCKVGDKYQDYATLKYS